jgi:hypothetical protein
LALSRTSGAPVATVTLALLGAMLLGMGLKGGPLCGVHTIRADDRALSLVHEAGCSFVVQLFDWSQIEPMPGEYFWEYPDFVVRACEHYRLGLVVRLDQPPEWALSPGADGPPVDVDAYAAFVSRVAQRYESRVEAYILWNEPNLAQEWGGRSPDPGGYVDLLRAAYGAVKGGDPHALVISAGLAPTNWSDETAMDDRVFLAMMYAEGAAEFFDVLGAHPYGFAYPPDDAHDAHEGLNFARLEDLREVMVANGDGHKQVWATEVGWTTEAATEDQAWFQVTEEEQASYLIRAFEKAEQEWPWLARLAVWNLSAGLGPDDEKSGYSIVDDQYRPRPAYEALAAMPKSSLPARAVVEADGGPTVILAPDVVVRLGDVDTFHPHWARIYGGEAPCRHWTGQFYLEQPGDTVWQLSMEIMQVEEQGNLVRINGHSIRPEAIPLRGKLDYASSWSLAFMTVPAGVLQQGLNEIEVWGSPRLPVYQDHHATFESLQFRSLRLLPFDAT